MDNVFDATVVDAAIEAATRARNNAYAPYSRFSVGAAVVDANGGIHSGCNVENASYGLTNCAERAAVAAATVAGCRSIVLCVVVTDTQEPVSPCGACRQVLAECSATMAVLCVTMSGLRRWHTISSLLPDAFDGSCL